MAKPMTIYGRILSPFVARAVLAAKAKGFKYELVLPEDGIKTPAFLKMNPFGQLSTLKDGKTVVYELPVVVEYLEAKSRANKLVPSAAKAAGQVRLIAAVAAEYVQMPAVKLFRHKRGTLPEPLNVETAVVELSKGLDALEHVMAKGKYAGGAKFSLADVYVGPALVFALKVFELFNLGAALATRPKVAKYWAAIQKDKIAKPVLADMGTAMVDILSGKLPLLK